MESRLECLLLGVAPSSPSSSIHFLFTGPKGEGRRVMGERERREVQPRLVGEEEGEGEKERLGTAICIEGEKHCFPGTEERVGEGEGEGEVRGDGKGPTPIVRGCIGSMLRRLLCPEWRGSFGVSDRDRSSQLWLKLFSILSPLCTSLSVCISNLLTSLVSSTFSLLSLAQPAPMGLALLPCTGEVGGPPLVLVLHLLHLLPPRPAGRYDDGLSRAAAVCNTPLAPSLTLLSSSAAIS